VTCLDIDVKFNGRSDALPRHRTSVEKVGDAWRHKPPHEAVVANELPGLDTAQGVI
jgi:hypothetical protein